MYVCLCNAVTDKAIKQAVRKGHNNFAQISKELNVATCCGQCKSHAQEIICEAKAEQNTNTLAPLQIPCAA